MMKLLDHFIRYDLPNDFWCKIYNVGSGEEFRFTNYELENRLLSTSPKQATDIKLAIKI